MKTPTTFQIWKGQSPQQTLQHKLTTIAAATATRISTTKQPQKLHVYICHTCWSLQVLKIHLSTQPFPEGVMDMDLANVPKLQWKASWVLLLSKISRNLAVDKQDLFKEMFLLALPRNYCRLPRWCGQARQIHKMSLYALCNTRTPLQKLNLQSHWKTLLDMPHHNFHLPTPVSPPSSPTYTTHVMKAPGLLSAQLLAQHLRFEHDCVFRLVLCNSVYVLVVSMRTHTETHTHTTRHQRDTCRHTNAERHRDTQTHRHTDTQTHTHTQRYTQTHRR